MEESLPRARVEVDTRAVVHNFGVVRSIVGDARVMPVVKADAYGHGLEEVVRALDEVSPSFFGVANVAEARRVAAVSSKTPPFLLGPSAPGEREEIARRGWGVTLSSWEEAQHFENIAAGMQHVLPVHLAFDTGMGREGFLPEELGSLLPQLSSLSHLRVEGVMSHMPCADEDEEFSRSQIRLFEQCVNEIAQHTELHFVHLAASAGILRFKIPCANMVRPGLMLYGVSPVPCLQAKELRPTLRLLATVTLVRTLPPEHGVSYGRSYMTSAPTRVATIGIGYADGWRRCFSGKGVCVCIRGVKCPTLGRVTMDQIMADVSAVPEVQTGDEAELIGSSQQVEELARLAGTIPWDIFTGLGPRLNRCSCHPAAMPAAPSPPPHF